MTTPNFIRLTKAYDDEVIWVNPALVQSISADSEGITRLWGAEGVDAFIRVSESVDEVMKAILGEGGAP
jgi:hypothetical protein